MNKMILLLLVSLLTLVPTAHATEHIIAGEYVGVFNGFNWTGSTWQSDTDIVSGLVDVGTDSTPAVFQNDSTWYLISGNNSGVFIGYNWTGSTWQSDTDIVSGLGDVGARSTVATFQNDSTWYLIAGEAAGVFNGFNWTGSTWQSDTDIVSGLVDVGTDSTPAVFQNDSTWYLISGNNSGVFIGYNWTGSTWQSDTDIVSGLGNIVSRSAPTVFKNDSTWYLVAGNESGTFTGFNWTGSTWQSDTAIASGLGDVGAYSKPCYFDMGADQTPDPTSLTHSKGTTWVNHTWSAGTAPYITDSYNVSVNSTWHNGTTNAHYNNTPIPSGNWSNITVWAWNSTYSELSSGSVSENVQTSSAAAGAPDVTSSGYTDNLWPEVYDSKTFNITVNQTTECRWYINDTLKQTNSTPSLTHAYTNTSLEGGHWNFSAVVNNTNGSDIQTWNFEVGTDSITHIILADDPNNKSMIAKENITRVGTNVTDWGINLTYTFEGWTYYFRFTNGTEIMNATCASDNESMYFNGTSLLPIGVYFINATTDVLTANANQYFLFNNWTIDQTFSQIAANESNDICINWYNHTSGLHEAYYVGRGYNANAIIPANCSVFTFFDAETTIAVTPRTT